MKPIVVQAAAVVLGVGLAAVGAYPHHAPTVTVDYRYTPDAAAVVAPLIAKFNAEGHEVDGYRILVAGNELASGTARNQLQAGAGFDAWTPASSVWGGLVAAGSSVELEQTVPSLMSSPQVISLWRSCAEELARSGHPIGWDTVIQLARTKGRYTQDCQGFELGATEADLSTSGLFALASWYALATGVSAPDGQLKLANLRGNRHAQRYVRHVEQLPQCWWQTSTDAARDIAAGVVSSVDGVYLQETSVVRYNHVDDPSVSFKVHDPGGMVAVYPSGGTYVADYPYYTVLNSTTTGRSAAASRAFGTWLAPQLTGLSLSQHGFRTPDLSAPIDQRAAFADYGATPDLPMASQLYPDLAPNVAQWLLTQWSRTGSGLRACHGL